jgi:D-threo-aldose 1-dehydrogenase
VLLIHDPDNYFDQAMTGAYRALDRLRTERTITAVGAGMNQAEMLTRFAREADFDVFLLAGRYTLLDQSGARELLPLCLERGIAVVAGGVFNSGILADPRPGAHYNYRVAPPELIERARQIAAICERHGVELKAAAIQFPLRHPAVTSVLTGCRSVSELNENLSIFQSPIPDELWAEVVQ